MVGVVGWLRQNLFSSPANSVLTILTGLLTLWVLPFRELPDHRRRLDRCGPRGLPGEKWRLARACWAFVKERLSFFIYGFYPIDQRWRVDIFFVLGAIGVAWMLWQKAPRRDIGFFYFIFALPLISFFF